MSILIKGMEMPKHGEGVCLIVTNFDSCGSPVAMLVDRESILPKAYYDAIEIPTPHGRLIDADKLLKVIEENSYRLRSVINSTENGMFLSGIRQAIDEAPTIIEAEE